MLNEPQEEDVEVNPEESEHEHVPEQVLRAHFPQQPEPEQEANVQPQILAEPELKAHVPKQALPEAEPDEPQEDEPEGQGPEEIAVVEEIAEDVSYFANNQAYSRLDISISIFY